MPAEWPEPARRPRRPAEGAVAAGAAQKTSADGVLSPSRHLAQWLPVRPGRLWHAVVWPQVGFLTPPLPHALTHWGFVLPLKGPH